MTSRPRRNACVRCAYIKQACDGGEPCSRCRRLNVADTCRPRSSPDRQGSGMSIEYAKAQIRRVHTGCLACKRRKKKCDEMKPRCGDCTRLCMECSWPNKPATSSPESQPSLSPATETLAGWSEPDFINIDFADMFDVDFALTADEDNSTYLCASPELAMEVASPSPRHVTPSTFPNLPAEEDKLLLNHFSNIVTSVLSRQPDANANPYLTHLLPMAMSNEMVLHSLLALSANHWHRLQPQLASRSLLYKSKASKALAGLLPRVDQASVGAALASCLLLCMSEILDGSSSGWKIHLGGAKRLLAMLTSQQNQPLSGNYEFLIRLCKFLDSATTTTTCMPPLIGKDKDARGLGSPTIATAPGIEDAAIYGLPKELFHLVDRVNILASKRNTRLDEASEVAFLQEAATVKEQLDHWSFEYGGLNPAVMALSPSSANNDVLNATIAFEWALRLRLHQVVEGYMLTDPQVFRSVTTILEAVQKIRYGSSLEGCLIFPLVMAGGACDQLEHRLIVQDRLMIMERTSGFGYVYKVRELVEKVWARREQSRGTQTIVNWARIRFEEMSDLVIF